MITQHFLNHSLKKPFKVGIFWGGGLGDLLVLRPLIKSLEADKRFQLYFFTTADHLPGVAYQLLGDINFVQLQKGPISILKTIKKHSRFFDLLYLGPYPTAKTRFLAVGFRSGKIWSRFHKNTSSYMLDQVLADIQTMDLPPLEYTNLSRLLPWPTATNHLPKWSHRPFLALHPGSKEKWETTRWSTENWRKLIEKILKKNDWDLAVLGTANETPLLNKIIKELMGNQKSRLHEAIDWPLEKITGLISASQGVICHNSGILHLSAMLGKKTVAVTGSSAKYWQPSYPWIKNITSGQCRFSCNSYRCPVPFFKAKCIRRLSVEKVLQAVESHFFSVNR